MDEPPQGTPGAYRLRPAVARRPLGRSLRKPEPHDKASTCSLAERVAISPGSPSGGITCPRACSARSCATRRGSISVDIASPLFLSSAGRCSTGSARPRRAEYCTDSGQLSCAGASRLDRAAARGRRTRCGGSGCSRGGAPLAIRQPCAGTGAEHPSQKSGDTRPCPLPPSTLCTWWLQPR